MLEVEASFDMPPAGGGFYFTCVRACVRLHAHPSVSRPAGALTCRHSTCAACSATYIVYGSQEGAWNEIDIGMINNVLGQARLAAAACGRIQASC